MTTTTTEQAPSLMDPEHPLLAAVIRGKAIVDRAIRHLGNIPADQRARIDVCVKVGAAAVRQQRVATERWVRAANHQAATR